MDYYKWSDEEHQKVKRFWKDYAQDLLNNLYEDGTPICDELCFDVGPDHPIVYGLTGIVIMQIKYNKKAHPDKIKTNFLTGLLRIKKKEILHSCRWILRPVSIRSQGRNTKIYPQDQIYTYLMRVQKKDIEEEKSEEYVMRIETLWNGKIKKKEFYTGKEDDFEKIGFAYPRQVVAKINRCLAHNFWPCLWEGMPYAAWIHTEEDVSLYMGISRYREYCIKGLQNVLDCCKLPAGAILISYTCFSILKPFFSTYHQLDKQSSYLTVKSRIENLIAVNIHSPAPEYAEILVKHCCGFFDIEEKEVGLPIVDGIAIQKNKSKALKLSLNEVVN